MPVRAGHWRVLIAAALGAAALIALPAPASADDEKKARAYWFAAFLGGAAVPTGSMSEGRKEGLAAVGRFGFVGDSGFGLHFTAEYSPLPHETPDRATTIQTHFSILSLAPRFTLGRGTVRAWIAAGGGVALERSTTSLRGMELDTEFFAEPAAVGEAGLELHFFQNGGLGLSGSYARSFGDLEARLYSVFAGLVFTFQ